MAIEFEKKSYPRLDGAAGSETHFTPHKKDGEPITPDALNPFSIIANGGGVRFQGKSLVISTPHQLDDLALALSNAWREYLKMKPRLVSGGGSGDGKQLAFPFEG